MTFLNFIIPIVPKNLKKVKESEEKDRTHSLKKLSLLFSSGHQAQKVNKVKKRIGDIAWKSYFRFFKWSSSTGSKESKKKDRGHSLEKLSSLFQVVIKHKKRSKFTDFSITWGSLKCFFKQLKSTQVLSRKMTFCWCNEYYGWKKAADQSKNGNIHQSTMNITDEKELQISLKMEIFTSQQWILLMKNSCRSV